MVRCNNEFRLLVVEGKRLDHERLMQTKSVTTTRWSTVAALVLTGMVAAMQVGKASIALPLLQR